MWIFAATTREGNQQKCGLDVQKHGNVTSKDVELTGKKSGK
jgi:hypothetical protein